VRQIFVVDPIEHREITGIPDEAARRAKTQREAPDDPDERDDAHADVVLDDDREDVVAPHETAVEER
jgi:hypothetical protein